MNAIDALRSIVASLTTRIDYACLYPSKVVSVNADKTVDIRPENPKIPAMSSVAVRGLSGIDVVVVPGAKMLLGFEGGDPSRPFAALQSWEGMQEVRVGGGLRPVARQSDVVMLAIPTPVLLTGVMLPPPAIPGAFTATAIIPTPLTGVILTGSDKLKA